MFAPCISSIKNTFLLFQLMHTVIKITEMLKQFKIIILAPTCFVSRRNHQQETVLCLAKTTEYDFFLLVGKDAVNIMAAFQPVVHGCGSQWRQVLPPFWTVVLAKHRTASWLWFLREPKHVGASVIILTCFNILWFCNNVHQLEQ